MAKTLKLKNDIFIANDLYQTTERIIGKWVNGETLYRKCLIFNDPIEKNDVTQIPHQIENAKLVMVKNAFVYNPNNNGKCYPLPVTLYESNTSTDYFSVKADRTNITFLVATGWGSGWYKVVILEYTKY